MKDGFINPGQEPFIYKTRPGEIVKPEKARRADRKHYGIKSPKSNLTPPCPECGRRTKCIHREGRPEGTTAPKIMAETAPCRVCGQTILKDAHFCGYCGVNYPGYPKGEKK